MHCFCNENQKKFGFCDDCDNYIHCKKVKHITKRLDNAYYSSLRRDSPWQPTNFFLYYEIDKKFKNIQKLVSDDFDFCIEIKYVRKGKTIDWYNYFLITLN